MTCEVSIFWTSSSRDARIKLCAKTQLWTRTKQVCAILCSLYWSTDQLAIDLIEALASALQIYAHIWLNPSIVDRAGIVWIAYNFAVDVSLSMSNSTVRLRACAALVIDQILSANMCKLQIQAAHLLLRARTTPAGMSSLSSAILIIPHPTECPTVCQFCNPHHRIL